MYWGAIAVVTATGSHLLELNGTPVSTPVAPGPTGLAFNAPPAGADLDGREGLIVRPRTPAAARLAHPQ